MKTTTLFAALALALGSGAVLANDIQIDAGLLPQDASAPFGHLFTHDVGLFTDTIDFTVPTGSLGSSAHALNLMLGSTSIYDISALSYSVWGGTSASDTVWYGTFPGNNISYDIGLSTPGAYHIRVTGNADGVYGGAYAIALVSGVPEPETYGMLLAGLGLVGFVARRRAVKTA
ncbi:FxDxF family PEP-CTERM protein [Rugamonas rubra]|uniref:PEP-CTERM protein-sorting domain-containing protein n=1 Tax=Rugamonas rubra TaxID=758825 RepID=A0A1I4HHD6_9BURK|nr:FxDxF family PEP-CTERM protein [Rugamonas rubra]SFL41625.1 PEP-CTERM protein-sorting domain-containing protein [Rugamonas rubra]